MNLKTEIIHLYLSHMLATTTDQCENTEVRKPCRFKSYVIKTIENRIEEALYRKTIYHILTQQRKNNTNKINFTNNAPPHNTDQRRILEIT